MEGLQFVSLLLVETTEQVQLGCQVFNFFLKAAGLLLVDFRILLDILQIKYSFMSNLQILNNSHINSKIECIQKKERKEGKKKRREYLLLSTFPEHLRIF